MHPGPFNSFLSETCAVDEKTVTVFTRELKEAGLMTTGGRGRYAPHMLPVDAVRALIALMATDRPSEAVAAVELWRVMRVSPADCVGDLPPDLFADSPTLEQALVRLVAVDPDPKGWPRIFPALQVSRNEKSAMLEWGLKSPTRAIFHSGREKSLDERRDMAGIRRSCLIAPAVLLNIASGMWVDRFQGSDEQGLPLDLKHSWNNEGSPDARTARRLAVYAHLRDRDVNWRKGAE